MTRLRGEDMSWEPIVYTDMRNIFVSGGVINPEQMVHEANVENSKLCEEEKLIEALEEMVINVISKDDGSSTYLARIHPCLPGEALGNWTVQDVPIIFRSKPETPIINFVNDAEFNPEVDFEQPLYLAEIGEEEEEYEIPEEFLRLMKSEDKQIVPHQEEIKILNLRNDDEDRKEVKIGTTLSSETRAGLISLLIEFKDIFAWTYQDMPGLDTSIVVHKLPIRPECKLVQQKLRRMRIDTLLKVRDEVRKQYQAGFLKVVEYLEWVANIVPVPKKDGKVRMCVDYRDLNKASPKDNFPLPHIDTIVDNTTGHSWFSFMDGFSGYNQI
ncbi:hypothetical protein HRI_001693500 [Hibiscus trionum]|uniref:Reverse transcriptase domain-containing protein n=2 Tax=Hibiscus trionum TaxID=183268 RepID=A0A9W7LXX7_HIBTR|nr:hypothetical protein HRI_001693500 [Hibiscus trionum]